MIGCWPFHDHHMDIEESVNRGLFGMIIVAPSSQEMPTDVVLPPLIDQAIQDPETKKADLKFLDSWLDEWSETGGNQQQIPGTGIIHAPLFFHYLNEVKQTMGFDSGDLIMDQPFRLPAGSQEETINYHCNRHSIMRASFTVNEQLGEESKTVIITRGNFNPNSFFIKPGKIITWVNNDSDIHTVTQDTESMPSWCINGRTFVGNTPTISATENQEIRFYVCNLDLGMMWHNYHSHAMRWKFPSLKYSERGEGQNENLAREDVRSIGPAESFVIITKAPKIMNFDHFDTQIEIQQNGPIPPDPTGWRWYDIKGDFLFHCHVEMHMMQGLAGIIRVTRRLWLYDYQATQIRNETGIPEYDTQNPDACPDAKVNRCEGMELGRWTIVPTPGNTMMHAILLPQTNKVLMWGYKTTMSNRPQSTIYDSDNNTYTSPNNQPRDTAPIGTEYETPDEFANVHSGDHTFLNIDDGKKILIHGGWTYPINQGKQTYYFRPSNSGDGTWEWEWLGLNNQTDDGRFYSTTLTLDDGKAITMYGAYSNNPFTGISKSIETFDPGIILGNKWGNKQSFPTTWTYVYYPFAYLLPDLTDASKAKIFFGGPAEKGYRFNRNTPGTGPETFPTLNGRRDNDNYQKATSVLLPLRPQDDYKPMVILMGGDTEATKKSTEMIDLSESQPRWVVWPNLNFPRLEQVNSVILPNSTIFLAGGIRIPGLGNLAGPAEILNLNNLDEGWKTTTYMKHPRGYHSAAILLPDGSVLMGGDKGEFQGDGIDLESERFYPSYFEKPRPGIEDNSFPETVNYDTQFDIGVVDDGFYNADKIHEVAIIRPGSVTHGFNFTQRFVELLRIKPDPNNLTVRVKSPKNGSIAPPGWYLLFIIYHDETCESDSHEDCSNRIPSVAKWIRITN